MVFAQRMRCVFLLGKAHHQSLATVAKSVSAVFKECYNVLGWTRLFLMSKIIVFHMPSRLVLITIIHPKEL